MLTFAWHSHASYEGIRYDTCMLIPDYFDIFLRLKLVGWKWPHCHVAGEPYSNPPP